MTAKRMLTKNLAWAQEMKQHRPDFFSEIAQGQTPKVLWIGCADSRVPAESITGALPGELFVHRNVANIINIEDYNSGSVIEYAVKILKIEHIVVCGHYQCGGVRAALTPESNEIPKVNQHIKKLRLLADSHQTELNNIKDIDNRVNRLVEINILDQIDHLIELKEVREANHALTLHGWVFNLSNGLLNTLKTHII